jgi:hypothetical protein
MGRPSFRARDGEGPAATAATYYARLRAPELGRQWLESGVARRLRKNRENERAGGVEVIGAVPDQGWRKLDYLRPRCRCE